MMRRWLAFAVGVAFSSLSTGCSEEPARGRRRGADAATPSSSEDGGRPAAAVCDPSADADGDGIADARELMRDADQDGLPNENDPDSDQDGIPDSVEGGGEPCRPLDTDADGAPDYLDGDSDADGLTDRDEATRGSNALSSDSDGDGIDDLTEVAAMSDPTSALSMPPPDSLYVVVPYHEPGTPGQMPRREFDFQTRVRSIDVMFVVDTTGSMEELIAEVRRTLSTRIIPGIVSALGPMGDARYGMSGFGDFGEGGDNYTGNVQVFQSMTRDAPSVQRATQELRAHDGGDLPESQVPALHALLTGYGTRNYRGTAIRNVDPVRDCEPAAGAVNFGWACFREGRVPILVLFSDSGWHNGPGVTTNFYRGTPTAPLFETLATEFVRRGAYFVGIDVGDASHTYDASRELARRSGTVDGSGVPIAFDRSVSSVANDVVEAVQQIADSTRQNVTTRTHPDPNEIRLTPGYDTADFIAAVRPNRGMPAAPAGFSRTDETTFYDVAPSTTVYFEVTFDNTFQPGGEIPMVFKAAIATLGRAGSEVDRRDVYIVVPAALPDIILD